MSKKQEDSIFVDIEYTKSKVEKNIEENKKSYMIIASTFMLIVAAYFIWNNFYIAPLEEDAQSRMFQAEKYFAQDSLGKALLGDGINDGFVDIIENYSVTKAANLANYYAGVCYLRKGEFELAIDYLKDFNSDDLIIGSVALGAIGDSYSELGNYEEAVSYYLKAAKRNEDKFSAPIYLMKAGIVYEELKEYDHALNTYEKIKKDYSETSEGREVEKYIGRVKSLTEN